MKTANVQAVILVLCATGSAIVAAADRPPLQSKSGRATTATAVSGSSKVESKLAAQFGSFAGSEDNARSLVSGLRTGTTITLNETTLPGAAPAPSPLKFYVPTKPMGYGNVLMSLALAKQQLANLGVTNPAPEELRAALVGGAITTGSGASAKTVNLPGILILRSKKMGWSKIAKSQGMNLGQVVRAFKGGERSTAASAAVSVHATSGVGKAMHPPHEIRAGTPEDGIAHGGSGTARVQRAYGHDTNGMASAAGTAVGSQGITTAIPQ